MDDTISDILIVGAGTVFIECFGIVEPTKVRFKDEEHLMRIINKIVASVGRQVDESSPLVDARLADGSRVNVAVRPVAVDGRNEILQRDLVKNALRMRPDRMIIGEVRRAEAFDMLQAMNTGHEGSMSTVHANTPRDAIDRIEQMVGMAEMPMSQDAIRAQISSAVNVFTQLSRLRDGTRRMT